MATDRLPLHLCNSIKQYGQISIIIEKLHQLTKFPKVKYSVFNLREKWKLLLFIVLISTQNASANTYSGRNSMLRTRVIGTRYGKLQGIILPMDQHKYLKPVEAYLGVPYATPPTGSNR